MPNPLAKIFSSPEAQARFLRLRVTLAGLAMDFWKDTPFEWSFLKKRAEKQKTTFAAKSVKKKEKKAEEKFWIADRIQVMEKMWGEGHSLPGGDAYIDMLAKPLGINKEMSVLDLSAGLGAMGRRIAEEFGAYVTGMEIDPALVSRGMILSIAAGKGKQASVESYQPEEFSLPRKYDCVFARELFYKIADKERFLSIVAEGVKPGGGQIVFTDFLVDSVSSAKPAVQRWKEKEGGATPATLHDAVKTWKRLGFDMRVAEDQTELYIHHVFTGFAEILSFLEGASPDRASKILVLKEIEHWASRLAAFKEGLKYYRFYGVKYKNTDIT